MPETLEALELERTKLYQRLQAVGDFRPGTISVNFRKCGKKNCACARKGHAGHGPQYLWNTTQRGQSRAQNLHMGPELEKVRKELATHRIFFSLCQQLVEVNEKICQLRPVQQVKDEKELEALKKKLHRQFSARWDGGGYRGAHTQCSQGHRAEFIEYRDKQLLTALSPIEVKRAYYHCEECKDGLIPKDQELDIVDTSFSPGVRRMMGQVGGKEPFEEGRRDLENLAGVLVKTKAVERVSQAIGQQIERVFEGERELALSGKVVPLKAVPKLYIAIDGTGVPVVRRETEGRKGKDETGKAKTREAKLGCVFTQTTLDENQRPVRDEHSTTYVGAIETAEAFGTRIYAEAIRRGVTRAAQVIVLGDGAHWIWGIAEEHFYGAIQIVDLYHAREHLALIANLVYGTGAIKSKEWMEARREQLDAGDVEAVIASVHRLRPSNTKVEDEVRTAADYFHRNAERMRYAEFRKQGLFVGSGVVEAGCKMICGQRLKLSGMHWTVRGANAIIALRCCQLSARWEEFWEARALG